MRIKYAALIIAVVFCVAVLALALGPPGETVTGSCAMSENFTAITLVPALSITAPADAEPIEFGVRCEYYDTYMTISALSGKADHKIERFATRSATSENGATTYGHDEAIWNGGTNERQEAGLDTGYNVTVSGDQYLRAYAPDYHVASTQTDGQNVMRC